MKVLSNALLHLIAGAAGLFIIFSLTAQGAAAAACTSSGPVGPKIVTATLDGAISSTVESGATDGCTLIAMGNPDQSGSITEFGYTWTLIQKDVFANLYGRVVPLPAAVWLFGSALLGLGVVKRRKA